MPDRRQHRGAHPEDRQLFGDRSCRALQIATAELSWLLTRGYAAKSALKLVGDRHALNSRQRVAVGRCACADQALARRQRHQCSAEVLKNQEVWIDGFNVLTSVEAALSGGVILQARDGCYRDMASMHGNYRRVEETLPAIRIIGAALESLKVTACRWLLDQSVSNSGRLKTMLRMIGEENHWQWQIDLLPDPDPVLISTAHIAATSDSQILDRVDRWFNLTKLAIRTHVPEPWYADLSKMPDAL